ncbi:bifunctional 4-hydroxy-2-oxoglutarate aldolase/2-dehydro-3-deoxy-phosphogluconate aldolase [Solirubrobacter taibaiensis]|nr:bifunctional 4-hydroxy-2-oxoglutarate aldolase/2-dehydro-3-deoxy-phosphogluconate aldolase [Solirubrobacter taibaiensis]
MSWTTPRIDTLEARLRSARVVPVIRVGDPVEAEELVARLLEAGLGTIELTTTIPGWDKVAASIRDSHPQVSVGIGTILSAGHAREAVAAGADFCVSPTLVPGAAGVLQTADIPLLEGGFTPTEVLDAASRGIAKLFPAHALGARYLKSLLAVAPDARIMPTGGIPLSEVQQWLDAGAIAVGVGSDLTAPGDIGARLAEALLA